MFSLNYSFFTPKTQETKLEDSKVEEKTKSATAEEYVEPDDEKYYKEFHDKYSSGKPIRNLLLASLVGLSTIGAVIHSSGENRTPSDCSNRTEVRLSDDKETRIEEIYKNAMQKDSIVRTSDIYTLLDKGAYNALPKKDQRTINVIMSCQPTAIKLKDPSDIQKIRNEAIIAQNTLNSCVEFAIKPTVSPEKRLRDHLEEYITGVELAQSLDYSKLLRYQKDLSVLQSLIAEDMPKLRRKDPHCVTKFGDIQAKAQQMVDNMAQKCKIRSYTVGNDNGDKELSAEEFLSTLHQGFIPEDLPKKEKAELLSSVLPSSGIPMDLSSVNSIEDAKKVNEKLGPIIQEAQNKLDAKVDSIYQVRYQQQLDNMK